MKIDPQERAARAKELFTTGYNCAQAVALAYADVFDITPQQLATLAAPFGGGMGRLREVCGAVSGMSMVAGALAPAGDITHKAAKTDNYKLVQKFAEAFRRENGSIICRELLGLSCKAADTPTPSDRTPEYYKKRPCAELVAMSAQIIAQHLTEHPSEK